MAPLLHRAAITSHIYNAPLVAMLKQYSLVILSVGLFHL